MSFDYNQRVSSLKLRRSSPYVASLASQYSEKNFDQVFESYQEKSSDKTLQYILVSMQEVDGQYTGISYREAERVQNQLSYAYNAFGKSIQYEYQGSVPLNIHIKGSSDVDFLVLNSSIVTHQHPPLKVYTPCEGGGGISDIIVEIRQIALGKLRNAFPEATVEPNSKSIKIYGGSLGRSIDVVPAAWHDTIEYQSTGVRHSREVTILDTSSGRIVRNRPFLHIEKINMKDVESLGGAKKAIRFLKNLKSDSDYDIKLTSYDIASIIWHMPSADLTSHAIHELNLLAEIYKYITNLSLNEEYSCSLQVPDGTRKIFDSKEKFHSLAMIQKDILQVASDAAQTLSPSVRILPQNIYQTIYASSYI